MVVGHVIGAIFNAITFPGRIVNAAIQISYEDSYGVPEERFAVPIPGSPPRPTRSRTANRPMPCSSGPDRPRARSGSWLPDRGRLETDQLAPVPVARCHLRGGSVLGARAPAGTPVTVRRVSWDARPRVRRRRRWTMIRRYPKISTRCDRRRSGVSEPRVR